MTDMPAIFTAAGRKVYPVFRDPDRRDIGLRMPWHYSLHPTEYAEHPGAIANVFDVRRLGSRSETDHQITIAKAIENGTITSVIGTPIAIPPKPKGTPNEQQRTA